jgi:hypothetical protein
MLLSVTISHYNLNAHIRFESSHDHHGTSHARAFVSYADTKMDSTTEMTSERYKEIAAEALARYAERFPRTLEVPDRKKIEITHYLSPRTRDELPYHASQMFTPRPTGYKYFWFCDYKGEDVLVLENFKGETVLDIEVFLGYIDHLPQDLPVMGGRVKANWTRVVIISQRSLHDLYENTIKARPWIGRALDRRLTHYRVIRD